MLPLVDCLQVGARNMQNFNLLRELGQVRKPILLKRGIAATIGGAAACRASTFFPAATTT
jgi:3-deoxy-D-arabino-heptulosonate 7-phosphate (DAHP) synthase